MTGAADVAREKLLTVVLAEWSPGEIRELARLSRRLIDAIAAAAPYDQLMTQEPRGSPGHAASPPERRRRSIAG